MIEKSIKVVGFIECVVDNEFYKKGAKQGFDQLLTSISQGNSLQSSNPATEKIFFCTAMLVSPKTTNEIND